MKKLLTKVHRNIPQMMMLLINAVQMVLLYARGTGKTRGATSAWIYERVKLMPRGTGFICSPSYTHLIDTIIPEMQQGWADYKLKEGVHYWLYEAPPKELGIPTPYLPITKKNQKYHIFWVNGSVTKLVSLDRKALVNSKSFDYGAICEGRKCNGKIVYDDLIPTLRGGDTNLLPDKYFEETGRRFFKDEIQHHSLLIESDLPKRVSERWILDFNKEMDVQAVQFILKLQSYKYRIIDKEKLKATEKAAINLNKIAEVEALIDELREDLVYVGKASTIDNIHVLGVKTIKELQKRLSWEDYETSVLGIERTEVDNCFYAGLSKEAHGYDGIDYRYIDNVKGKLQHDWRWDKDINLNAEFDVVMDCNAIHNCMGITQRVGSVRKLINYFYVLSSIGEPKTHVDLAENVCDYYEDLPLKRIKLIYNHTMKAGGKAGLSTKWEEVRDVFKARGWKVSTYDLGQAMWHEDLYENWQKAFSGKLAWRFQYNIQNCDVWYEGCKDAPIKIIDDAHGHQIKKDKSSEKDESVPPQEATHSTEAVDQILQYEIEVLSDSSRDKMIGAAG